MASIPKVANERWDVAWRGFAPGSWQSRVNVREFIQRNYTPYEGDGAFLQGAYRAHQGHVEDAAAAARQGTREGHSGRFAGPVEHPRARPRLHRQGQRAHRRPADRRAAQARDHAVRRLARGRGEPRILRLQAGRASSAKSSPSTARRTTTAYSTPTRRTSGRRGPRGSSPACRMPTAAAASSATIAGSRSTASISSSPTRSARRRSSMTGTRRRTSSACARSSPSRSGRSRS